MLDRVVNMREVLNIPGFQICQDSEYADGNSKLTSKAF